MCKKMVRGRSILAGIVGIVCAIAVLGFIALSQSVPTFGPASNLGNLVSESSSSSQALSTQTTETHSSSNLFGSESPFLGSQSGQTIDNPMAMSAIALLGGISLLVSLGVAFLISRRLG